MSRFSFLDQRWLYQALCHRALIISRRLSALLAMLIIIASYQIAGYAEPLDSTPDGLIQGVSYPQTFAEDHLRVRDLGSSMPSQSTHSLSPLGSSPSSPLDSERADEVAPLTKGETLDRHWMGLQLGGQGIFTFLYQYMPWSWLGLEAGMVVSRPFIQSSLGLMITMWQGKHWSFYLAGGGTWLLLGEDRVTESCQDQQCEITHETLAHFHAIKTTRIGIAYFWGENQQHKCTVEGGLWWSTSLLEGTWLHHQNVTAMMGLGYLHSF